MFTQNRTIFPSFVAAVFGCLLMSCLGTTAKFGTYTNRLNLGKHVFFSWKVDSTYVYFFLEKYHPGHLVFGIGESMSDADIVTITRKDDNSAPVLTDCRLEGRAAPVCGELTEDWSFVKPDSYEMTAISMIVEIQRPFAASGNDKDKTIIKGKNTFIYSYNANNTVTKHDGTGDYGTAPRTIGGPSSYSSHMKFLSGLLFLAIVASAQ